MSAASLAVPLDVPALAPAPIAGTVYHFTDTARLPWILLDGMLKPGRNRIGGFPDPDFLWATTAAIGDRTASASVKAFRDGLTLMVRFDLDEADFERWPDITSRFPNWTPGHVARLRRAAGPGADASTWRCRIDPLSRDRWLAIWVRSYRDRAWRPLPVDTRALLTPTGDTAFLNTLGRGFASRRLDGPYGAGAYELVEAIRT